jgi:hypothetical protein
MNKRAWHTTFIKHLFAERVDEPWPKLDEATIRKHNDERLKGWEAQILRLPAPIVAFSADIHRVFQAEVLGTEVRIYPPFPIDRRGEMSGSFRDCWLPEGQAEVQRHVRLPSDAATGLTAENVPIPGARYCQGIRVDTKGPAKLHQLVQVLLEQLCQHTHQWWLRGRTDPFSGIRRLGCDVNRDFAFTSLLRHHSAGKLASHWHAVIESQRLLGVELVLTEAIWRRCLNQAAMGMRGDMGLLAFHDAISYYMDADEVLCIMSMTIAVEILGNKRRMLLGKRPTGFAELLKSSDLISNEIRPILQSLFVDRGHVAHGRRPPKVKDKPDGLFAYLEAVRTVVAAYTSKLTPEDWPKASQLEIARGSA